MDALGWLNSRHIDVDALFTNHGPAATHVNYNGAMSALGYTLEKQVRTWWDICTLEQYIKEKVIIRSLRWDIALQDSLDDQGSLQEWVYFFNGVSFKLQELIIQRKKRKMANIKLGNNDLQQLDPIKDTQQIIDFNNRVKKSLEKVDRDTQNKKLKKYHRDLDDFKANLMYSWQQPSPVNKNITEKPISILPVMNNIPAPSPYIYDNEHNDEITQIASPALFSTPIKWGGGRSRGTPLITPITK